MISVLAFHLLMPHKLGRLILRPAAAVLWILLIGVRRLLLALTSRGFLTRRALLIVGGAEASEAIRLVRGAPRKGG